MLKLFFVVALCAKWEHTNEYLFLISLLNQILYLLSFWMGDIASTKFHFRTWNQNYHMNAEHWFIFSKIFVLSFNNHMTTFGEWGLILSILLSFDEILTKQGFQCIFSWLFWNVKSWMIFHPQWPAHDEKSEGKIAQVTHIYHLHFIYFYTSLIW